MCYKVHWRGSIGKKSNCNVKNIKISNEYICLWMKMMRANNKMHIMCVNCFKIKKWRDIGCIITKRRGEKIRVITVADVIGEQGVNDLCPHVVHALEAVVNKWRVCGSWFYIFLLCTRFLGFERRKIVLSSLLLSRSSFLLHLSSLLCTMFTPP